MHCSVVLGAVSLPYLRNLAPGVAGRDATLVARNHRLNEAARWHGQWDVDRGRVIVCYLGLQQQASAADQYCASRYGWARLSSNITTTLLLLFLTDCKRLQFNATVLLFLVTGQCTQPGLQRGTAGGFEQTGTIQAPVHL